MRAKFNIMKEEWDYLIVLDACRYDYFERVWEEYFNEGELSKVVSAGSSTVEWRDNTFAAYYSDVIYISSNPYIKTGRPVKGFSGSEHFTGVYDLWRDGWDKSRGTVLPETVTTAAISAIKRDPSKRFIIHYLQPHAPYLDLGADSRGFPVPDLASGRALEGIDAQREAPRVTRALVALLAAILRRTRLLGNQPDWRLRELLRLDPASPMDAVRRECGKRGLRQAYARNLELVLREVQVLVGHLAGRIVITADHGELLGEGRCYSHWNGSNNPYLLEIPRLVIERERRSLIVEIQDGQGSSELPPADASKAVGADHENEEVEERLRALGYVD